MNCSFSSESRLNFASQDLVSLPADQPLVSMNGKRADQPEDEQPRKRSWFDKPASSLDAAAAVAPGQQSAPNGVAQKPALPSLSALENAKKALQKRKELAEKMNAAGVRAAQTCSLVQCVIRLLFGAMRDQIAASCAASTSMSNRRVSRGCQPFRRQVQAVLLQICSDACLFHMSTLY